MKNRIIIILFAVAALLPGPLNAQNNPFSNSLKSVATTGASEKKDPASAVPDQGLPRFDLNFSGGTPDDLVRAIQHATGRPLNVIIPDEQADVAIPQLNMKGVTLTELFTALGEASRKLVSQVTGTYFGGINGQASSQFQTSTENYTFTTKDYPPREDSIWYFFHNVPPKPPGSPAAEEKTSVRYFQLGPYLDTYKVEDITTAIETGWWMQSGHHGPMPKPGTGFAGGQSDRQPMPQLSFHKDTKLLIAAGDPAMLNSIDAVLRELQPQGLHFSYSYYDGTNWNDTWSTNPVAIRAIGNFGGKSNWSQTQPNPGDAKSKPAAGHESQTPAKSGESDKQ